MAWAVRGSNPGRSKGLFPVQNFQIGCGYRGSFLGVNRPGREVNHILASSAEVKNKWRYTSGLGTCLHGVDTVTQCQNPRRRYSGYHHANLKSLMFV